MKTLRAIPSLAVFLLLLASWACNGATPTPTSVPTSPPPTEAAALPPTPTLTPLPAPLVVEIRREPDSGTQPLSPGQRILLIAVLSPDQPATFKWSISGEAKGTLKALGGNSAEYIAGQQAGEDAVTADVVATSGATGTATTTFTIAVTPSPTEEMTPVLADFDNCIGVTKWGDPMGAAFTPGTSNTLREEYIPEAGRDCVAKLTYEIADWAAFWLKLGGRDLSAYNTLTFDIKADPAIGVPIQMKVELKKSPEVLSIAYVPGISDTWQTINVSFSDFGSAGFVTQLPDFTDMSELVFTFEARYGTQSVVYLDNITFEQR